jgi:peptidoglycan/LPS O-acetylase OafA/YrhL
MQRPAPIQQPRDIDRTLMLMRGIAVYGIMIENFLTFIPYENSPAMIAPIVQLAAAVGGTMVHVFFLLSGCGLWLSYKKRTRDNWRKWAYRRFRKIVWPYWLIVAAGFLIAVASRFVFHEGHAAQFTLETLLAYLTFTRNFVTAAHSVNPALWFMPVIFGLYLLFPVMAYIQTRFGSAMLLGCSITLTYASIAGFQLGGFPAGHQSAMPVFFTGEFALGMVWGHLWLKDGQSSGTPNNIGLLIVGLSAYSLSLLVTRQWTAGSDYNDLLTAIGIGAILMAACDRLRAVLPLRALNFIADSSRLSYLMYLIHGFVILYIALPIMQVTGLVRVNTLVVFLLSLAFCWMIYLMAKGVSIFLPPQ